MKTKKRGEITVLIVEDQLGMRRIIRTVLQSLSANSVVEAGDGAQALEILRARNRNWAHDVVARNVRSKLEVQPIDLILADWAMPNMTGLELLRAVRKDPNWMNLPFVMLTAEDSKEQIVEAMKLGVTDYVIKPFTANVLEAKLRSLIEEKFAED